MGWCYIQTRRRECEVPKCACMAGGKADWGGQKIYRLAQSSQGEMSLYGDCFTACSLPACPCMVTASLHVPCMSLYGDCRFPACPCVVTGSQCTLHCEKVELSSKGTQLRVYSAALGQSSWHRNNKIIRFAVYGSFSEPCTFCMFWVCLCVRNVYILCVHSCSQWSSVWTVACCGRRLC